MAISEPPARAVIAPPRTEIGTLGWMRKNLFGNWADALITLVLAWLLIQAVTGLIEWGLLNAVWTGSAEACHAAREAGGGACWAVIDAKHRFMLFGRYTYDEQWRPALAILLLLTMMVASCYRALWGRGLTLAWVATFLAWGILMWGGLFGLTFVPHENWGGLPLTIVLGGIGVVVSFPIGILLALGRRSDLPAIKALCTAFIELIRGVPFITVLFMSSVMIPLFLPQDVTIDKLLRAQIGFILFTSAYMAETVRAGLQSIPKGQYEAADALGLGYWQKTVFIILPQALRIVIPPLMNNIISAIKDTSLVVIIGLFDFLNTVRTGTSDPVWRSFYVEGYVFAAAIYFFFCFFMSRYSQWIESGLARSQKR